jgi:hypothetical protein
LDLPTPSFPACINTSNFIVKRLNKFISCDWVHNLDGCGSAPYNLSGFVSKIFVFKTPWKRNLVD